MTGCTVLKLRKSLFQNKTEMLLAKSVSLLERFSTAFSFERKVQGMGKKRSCPPKKLPCHESNFLFSILRFKKLP